MPDTYRTTSALGWPLKALPERVARPRRISPDAEYDPESGAYTLWGEPVAVLISLVRPQFLAKGTHAAVRAEHLRWYDPRDGHVFEFARSPRRRR